MAEGPLSHLQWIEAYLNIAVVCACMNTLFFCTTCVKRVSMSNGVSKRAKHQIHMQVIEAQK